MHCSERGLFFEFEIFHPRYFTWDSVQVLFQRFATNYICYVSLFLFFFQIYLHQLISLTSNKMTVNLEFIWVNLVSFFTKEYVPSLEEQPGQGRRNRGCRGPFPLPRFCLKKKQNDLLFQKALNYQFTRTQKFPSKFFTCRSKI